MKHFNVTFRLDGRQISIHANATLLEAAGQAGIILNSVCGGKGTCKKCLINLESYNKQVLACQHHIDSDLTVTIPTTSRFYEQKILAHGIDVEAIIPRKPPAPAAQTFGLAVDIGTTTVVAKLIDIATGRCTATAATLNPQARHGDDVISRIAYAQTDPKLAELQKLIIDCINELIADLSSKASIDTSQIHQACIVGNTTMNHIFLKLPITSLGRAPYNAYSLDANDLPAKQLSLEISPDANVHTVENIAGFVGSDTTAVALAVDIDSAEEMMLVVDIGTNGELVLGTADKLYAASCAAGPALEGARITCGSRAVAGAIEAVFVNDDDIDVDVIGSQPPRSICGSGLVDAVAVLLDLGIIDATGRFVESEKLSRRLPLAILPRIIEQDGQPAFVITDQTSAGGQRVLLTQKDIREVQLAKAAIRAGTKLLQQKLNLTDDDIKQILLAGAFGNYIRRESAVRIGLLPDIPVERIRFVGNAASSGAQMILLSGQYREQARQLARKIEYVEVAHEEDFESVFADAMAF
ncbi:MAG: DUF4445 domain-containing protein [Planctomycetota bacterium]|nr:MAG: DUF4445 domain-containing protein [Planctomycetota bacterium]